MNFIRKYKLFIIRALIFAGFFFLIGFYRKYHVPRIKQWLLVEIENQSQKHSPVRFWPKSVDLEIFPIGATFYNIKALPQKSFEKIIEPTEIAMARIELNMWSLVKGELRIGEIHIDGSDLNVHVFESNEKSKLNFSLKNLEQLPIDKISASNINIKSLTLPGGIVAKTPNVSLAIANVYNTLRVGFDIEGLEISKAGQGSIFEASIGARLMIDPDGLYFSNIKIHKDNSFILGTGSVTGDLFNKKINNIKTKMRGDLNLQEVHLLATQLLDSKKIPKAKGKVQFDAELDYSSNNTFRANYKIKTNNLTIDHYDINSLELDGSANENEILITNSKIENTFGRIKVKSGHLKLNDNLTFDASVTADKLELSRLLNSLGLPDVPVYTHISGELPCSGQIKNKFNITCNGALTGKDFSVLSGVKNPFTIVAFKEFGAKGTVTVTDKAVTYKSDISIGKSQGKSSGTISYADGFKINYSTPGLNFSDISDLASLKPEGKIEITGTTKGNSHSATLDLSAKGEDIWLYNYFLGRMTSSVRYKKGTLYLNSTEAQIGSSRIKGDIDINLIKKGINLDVTSPFIDADDLMMTFKRKIELPFKITGTGSAKLIAHGPLEFSKLSYNLNSSLYRGTIADETYDQVQFNVVSKNGFVETKQVSLSKGRSTIAARGKVNPEGQLNLVLQGKDFQIEQSENLARLKTNLTGNLNFEVTLTDYILKPNINLIGSITHVMLGEQPSLNSKFKISLNEKFSSGEISLLGTALKLKFNNTFGSKGSTDIDLKTDKWNIAQTFSIFSESLRSGSYQTNLSSELHVVIPNSAPLNFDAEFSATELFLRNGKTEMTIDKPLKLSAKNGIIKAENFEIIGENTFIRLKSTNKTKQELALTLDGRLDLSLASLLTPFLDDLKGLLRFSFSLDGTYQHPTLSGSAFIEDGLVKIKGFPHALEQISADVILNNENIIINSAKGKVGGGQFNAGGRVSARSIGNVPVDIKGIFYDSSFNVPEGFSTRGSGELFVRGAWFPYTVGVNFNVDSGSVEMRTLDNSKSTPGIKPSSYLPKSISARQFSPVDLALDINIRRALPIKISISRVDIRSEALGRMKIEGPPQNPLLTGKINIVRGGKISFRNNIFEIKNGTVEYDKAVPSNPTLNIQADARVTAQLKNNETRDYDIDMRVQGTATNPKITLASQPALPENDLISLLTLGFINEESSAADTTREGLIANTSSQLLSAVVTEQLDRVLELNSKFGMQLDINSSYDSEDKAEKHKVTIRKQITPKFGASASREIGKTTTNNVKAEYKLNKNLSVIGEWEGKEPTTSEQSTQSAKDLNIFGLDIEYKVDFK